MIFPADHASPPRDRPPANDACVVYELRASNPLPVIDCSKSLKSALFSARWLQRYNAFQRATKRILRVSFALSMVLACMFVFLDRRTGQWVVLASSVLLICPLVSAYLILRMDILKLLVRTYEFWYITFVSIVSSALVCISLKDARASLHICLTATYQYAMLMDANNRDPSSAIIGSVIGAAALGTFVVCVSFRLVHDYDDGELARYGQWTLNSSDVVVSGFSVIALVILRNAYRKRAALATLKNTDDCATVRCITYRTRLQFVAVDAPSCPTIVPVMAVASLRPMEPVTTISDHSRRSSSSPVSRPPSPLPSPSPSPMSQMRLVPMDLCIRACDFIQPWMCLPSKCSATINRLWTLVGIAGIATTTSGIAFHPCPLSVALVGYVCTVLYCLRCILYHNKQLLRHIMWSFDYLFLSVQSCLEHIVLCHLVHWELRMCFLIMASWLWMYWTITLDLLTPLVRKRLGVSMRLATLVLVLHLLGHAVVSYDVIGRRKLVADDRVLFHSRIGGRDLFAVPFLLNRMATTFCWCLRLLWRLHTGSQKDELLIIYGAVEYDDHETFQRLRNPNLRRGGVSGGGATSGARGSSQKRISAIDGPSTATVAASPP